MRYPFECAACGEAWVEEASIKVGAPEAPACPCVECEGVGVRVWTMPEVLLPGTFIDYKVQCPNVSKGARTGAEQEKHYGKIIGEMRDKALRAKRERGLSKAPAQRMEHCASVPREAWEARRRQFGKDYWQNEGKAALKRDGWLF